MHFLNRTSLIVNRKSIKTHFIKPDILLRGVRVIRERFLIWFVEAIVLNVKIQPHGTHGSHGKDTELVVR